MTNKDYIKKQEVLKILKNIDDKLENYFIAFATYCNFYDDDDDKESVRVNSTLRRLTSELIQDAIKDLNK